MALLRERRVGPAQLLLKAANELSLPDRGILETGVKEFTALVPKVVAWGVPDMRVDTLFWADTRLSNSVPQPSPKWCCGSRTGESCLRT